MFSAFMIADKRRIEQDQETLRALSRNVAPNIKRIKKTIDFGYEVVKPIVKERYDNVKYNLKNPKVAFKKVFDHYVGKKGRIIESFINKR